MLTPLFIPVTIIIALALVVVTWVILLAIAIVEGIMLALAAAINAGRKLWRTLERAT